MDNPVYHLPYSTNWFQPQIACFSKCMNFLALGINNIVHIINFQKKTPLKTIVPCCHERIHCIEFKSLEQLHIITKKNVYYYKQFEIISQNEYPGEYPLYCEHPYIIDRNGSIIEKNKIIFAQNGKVKFYGNQNMILEDQILFFDPNFNCSKKIQLNFKVLYCSRFEDTYLFLAKCAGKLYIKIWKDDWLSDFEIQFKGSLHDKPSLCAELFENYIIISGIKGELFKIERNNTKQIILDQNNLNTFFQGENDFQIEQSSFQSLLDNPHNKSIYHIYKYSDHEFVALSQDRKLSFWRNLKRYYTLDLLGAKYIQLETYDNQILALSDMHSIRKWIIRSQDKYNNYEIGNQLKNINIKQFTINFNQEGIIGISTDNQLGIYDLYSQKLIKLTNPIKPIFHIQWIKSTYCIKEKSIPFTIQIKDNSFKQILSPENTLLAITKDSLLYFNQDIIYEYTYDLPQQYEVNKVLYISSIQLLIFGLKDSTIYFYHIPTKEKHQYRLLSNSAISSLSYNEFPFYICASNMNRDVMIGQVFMDEKISLEIIKEFKFKNPIVKSEWHNSNLLGVGYKSTGLQIWDSEGNETAFVRGHQGFITDAKWLVNEENKIVTCNHIILASEDLNLKIWDLSTIQLKKPPNKKKTKKIKLEDPV